VPERSASPVVTAFYSITITARAPDRRDRSCPLCIARSSEYCQVPTCLGARCYEKTISNIKRVVFEVQGSKSQGSTRFKPSLIKWSIFVTLPAICGAITCQALMINWRSMEDHQDHQPHHTAPIRCHDSSSFILAHCY